MKKLLLITALNFLIMSASIGQDIIISQYYEGSSNNKWIEVTNVGGDAIDLASPQLYLALFSNAAADDPANSSPNSTYTLTGTLNPGDVLLFQNSSAVLPNYCTGTSTTVCNFNGDDLIIISTSKSGTSTWANRIDVVGNGTTWGANTSFYRNTTIHSPNTTYTTSEWTQKTNADVDGASSTTSEYLGTHLINGFWKTGGSSSVWSSTSNWSDGNAPTSSTDVIIPVTATFYPSVDGDATTPSECNNLTIASGASLTIPAGKALTVNGDLTNNAGTSGLTIQSDNTGTGSLIVEGSVSGNSTMQRYIGAWGSSATSGWHFISSPNSGQEISTEFVDITATPISSDVDFYRWSESEELWINIKDGSGNYNQGTATTNFSNDAAPLFEVGKGYLIAYSSDQTKNFTGIFNTADVSFSGLTNTSGNSYAGWHLLGNPYPSALYWNNTSWSLSDIDGTAKIWNESTASYTDIAAGGIIPVTQGFMAHVTTSGSTSGSLTIDASDRVHNTTSWYKNDPTETSTIKLVVSESENNTAQESIIKIIDDATTGFDTKYDSRFLAGFAPQFYSVLEDGTAVSTNAFPDLIESTVIPFSFVKNSATNYKLQAEGINDLVPAQTVYLTDLKTNHTQKLNDNPVYQFTSEEGDIAERFELHFGPLGIDDNKQIENRINVFASNSQIEIRSKSPLNAVVNVYNITGRLIAKTVINNQSSASINTGDFSGIAIVSVIDNNQVFNQKVLIK